mmetsp:Transcript_65879/g.190009  ORF Transcript_65879/g.190009 Transcript_65879/m.190009 type:complete len:353 (-) Transcript_65879:661-1719(-)
MARSSIISPRSLRVKYSTTFRARTPNRSSSRANSRSSSSTRGGALATKGLFTNSATGPMPSQGFGLLPSLRILRIASHFPSLARASSNGLPSAALMDCRSTNSPASCKASTTLTTACSSGAAAAKVRREVGSPSMAAKSWIQRRRTPGCEPQRPPNSWVRSGQGTPAPRSVRRKDHCPAFAHCPARHSPHVCSRTWGRTGRRAGRNKTLFGSPINGYARTWYRPPKVSFPHSAPRNKLGSNVCDVAGERSLRSSLARLRSKATFVMSSFGCFGAFFGANTAGSFFVAGLGGARCQDSSTFPASSPSKPRTPSTTIGSISHHISFRARSSAAASALAPSRPAFSSSLKVRAAR